MRLYVSVSFGSVPQHAVDPIHNLGRQLGCNVQRFHVLGYLLGAVFFGLIIWGGWDLAIASWVGDEYEGEGALHVPAWPTRFIILLGSALAIVNYLVVAWLDVARPRE